MGPFGRVWLSLPQLVSNSVRTSTPLHLDSNSTGCQTQLSYIIVRRPLDLWNRMFNRYQAEINVMQFTGHSLPVHQSMSVPWEFFSSSHFISQFPPTRFPLITAIRICHFLPVHHLGMAFLAGFEGQNTTQSASSRIWTYVAMSIYYDNNYYTTDSSILFRVGRLFFTAITSDTWSRFFIVIFFI